MHTLEFKARKRDSFGKKESRAARREGMVPCVIYGGGENVHFSIPAVDLKPLIYTPNSYIVSIDIDGKKEEVVMREVQYHPVHERILHIDFYRIQQGKPVIMDIPVELVGVSEGVKQGGKMMLSLRKLRISSLAENLPDTIQVDVTNVKLGDSVRVGDLSNDKYSFVTPANAAICAVKMTRAARGAAAKAGN